MGAIGSSISQDASTVTLDRPSAMKIENISIAIADTEQSHSFPANTQQFLVRNRGSGTLKLASDLGQSGSVYYTLGAGDFYSSPDLSASIPTIYFQSPNAGLVLEMVSWS